MSRQEFLQSLRMARNMFFHGVGSQAALEDTRDLEAQLSRASIWLTPSSVKGFDPSEFKELSPDVREQLKDRVRQFLDVVEHIRPNEHPTQDEARRGTEALLDVVRILDPYLWTSIEAKKIREVLEGIDFPAGVVTWEF